MNKVQESIQKPDSIKQLESTEHSHSHTVPRVRPPRVYQDGEGALNFPPIPGYTFYAAIFSGDEYDREMIKLLDKGYEPVLRKEIDPYIEAKDRSLANANVIFPGGRGVRHILMKIPTEWKQEDYEKQVAKNKALEQGLPAGQVADLQTGGQGDLAPLPLKLETTRFIK